MKVIYDLEAYSFGPHGGVARMFSELIARFNSREDFSALFYRPTRHISVTPPLGPRTRVAKLIGITPEQRKNPTTRRLYHAISAAYWLCHGSDIFHPTFYPEDAELLRRTSVINIYDLTHEKVPGADNMPNHEHFLALKRRAVDSADRIVCISEATRDDFLTHYKVDPELVRVVHLGHNPAFRIMDDDESAKLVASIRDDASKPFLLYIGARQRYKNFHRLLQAYQGWSECKNVDLVAVGGDPTAMDSAFHDLAPGPGHVQYVKFPSDDVLCALYNRAHSLVYPSLSEGFGIPLLEAMASGCPLSVSDIPVFHEVAGDTASYFDPTSVEAMRAGLDTALHARQDAAKQGRLQERLGRFSWDRCAEAMWKIYEELT